MTYTPHSIILNVIFLLCFSCQSPKSSEAEENPPVLDPLPSSTPFTTIEHSLTDLHPPRTDTILSFQSRISIIFQDRKGDYWFASQGDGICHYDGTSFTYYDELQGLPRVRAIFEDKDGHICFGVEDGLTIFDGEEFETIRPLPSSFLISNSFSYPKDEDEKVDEENYQQAWKKEGEALWFSAFNKNGVYRYDGEKLRHLTLPVSEDDPDYGARGYHPEHGYDPYAVYSIYKDKNGRLWFGTAGRGLFRYDGKSIICINKNSKQGVVRAIHQEDSSRIWFGNNPEGIFYYEGDTLRNFSREQKQGLAGLTDALAMEEDTLGNIWIATFDSGLWKYDPSVDSSGQALLQYDAGNILKTSNITALFRDRQGILWVGTGNGDIFTFNGKGFDQLISNKGS